MPAFILYLALHRAGLTLETDGDKLTVTPANRLNDELRAGIREHKCALIELLKSAHHTAGRLLDWDVDLDPTTSAATAIGFRTASLNAEAKTPEGQSPVADWSASSAHQHKAHHDRTE